MRDRRSQLASGGVQVACQVASLIHHVYEELTDEPVRRICHGEGQLGTQMVFEGEVRRRNRLEVEIVIACGPRLAQRGPSTVLEWTQIGWCCVGKDAVEVGI